MTPEEKAVITAAIQLYHEGQNDHWTACAVTVAVDKLLASRAPAVCLLLDVDLAKEES